MFNLEEKVKLSIQHCKVRLGLQYENLIFNSVDRNYDDQLIERPNQLIDPSSQLIDLEIFSFPPEVLSTLKKALNDPNRFFDTFLKVLELSHRFSLLMKSLFNF